MSKSDSQTSSTAISRKKDTPGYIQNWSKGSLKFLNRNSKNAFLESLLKTVLRGLFSFFDIVSLDGSRGLWSLISGDDVITGNGPNQTNFMDF